MTLRGRGPTVRGVVKFSRIGKQMQMKSGITGGQARYSSATAGRLHLYGIDERSSGSDPVLAKIFKTMRASLGMPPADLARLLRMPLDVLAHLEAGNIRALPPLPETVRYVTDYGRLLDVDVKPILARIKEQTGEREPPLETAPPETAAGGLGAAFKALKGSAWLQRQPDQAAAPTSARTKLQPRSVSNVTAEPPAAISNRASSALQPLALPPRQVMPIASVKAETTETPAKTAKRSRSTRILRRSGLTACIALSLSAGVWSAAQSQSTVLYAAVDQLPSGLARSIRQSIDRMAVRLERKGDGLTWVVVNDPRSRKSDKLSVGKPGG